MSLEAQREKLEAYATLYDLELVATEVDAGVSAKTLKRPALKRALGHLERSEAKVLVVMKLNSRKELQSGALQSGGERRARSIIQESGNRESKGRCVV